MKKVLRHFWQLPQHIVAWCIIACGAKYRGTFAGRRVYTQPMLRGCSLGDFIFYAGSDLGTLGHEAGHSRQSLIFGWLYLIVVGLPSAMNIMQGAGYYRVWPEKQANKLGDVVIEVTGDRACDYRLKYIGDNSFLKR